MNPHRYSQIERALQILDKSGTVEILKDDPYLLFLFKKTERIVVALYVITGLFPDAESLKWELRDSGATLIKHVLSFKERAKIHSKDCLSDTLAELAHLHSLIDIAYVADLLSPMNFSILKKELEAVNGIIEGRRHTGNLTISHPVLDDNFFGIPKSLFQESGEEMGGFSLSAPTPQTTYQEGTKLQSMLEFERLRRNQKDIHKGQIDTKDNVLYKRHEVLRHSSARIPSGKTAFHPSSNQIKEGRKQHILSILRNKNVAMIKDFSTVIKDCSEKTIQRLLIEMVQHNVLKREGDRRWSRYSITESKGGL